MNDLNSVEAASCIDSQIIEEEHQKLRVELEGAKENEDSQRRRADKLHESVEKFEQILKRIDENSSTLTPIHSKVGNLLEHQYEKLEDKLAAVREEAILERQAARSANLNVWKAEKQFNELREEKKLTQRRLELTQERMKHVQTEHEEMKIEYKNLQLKLHIREESLQERKEEIHNLKRDLQLEHKKWEDSEHERNKAKSDVIERIATVQKLHECVYDLKQKLQHTQSKYDALHNEHKNLQHQLSCEQKQDATVNELANAVQTQLKQLQSRYEQLKHACTVTDNQLTKVENLLRSEQNHNELQQSNIDKIHEKMRKKDEFIAKLQRELTELQCARQAAETQVATLCAKHAEEKQRIDQSEKQYEMQHEKQLEHQQQLFATQERIEVLTQDNEQAHQVIENIVHELNLLKAEHSRILTELFYTKEESQHLLNELKNAQQLVEDLQADIDELKTMLTENEQFYIQRDIKAEATLAQYKKLIDYLQVKNEDFMQSHKKKKSLSNRLFGAVSHNNVGAGVIRGLANGKETICPDIIESSILYRTIQAELNPEKQQCKSLQQQIEKLKGKYSTTSLRSPLKQYKTNNKDNNNDVKNNYDEQQDQPQNDINFISKESNKNDNSNVIIITSNQNSTPNVAGKKEDTIKSSHKYTRTTIVYHRFELCIAQNADLEHDQNNKCLACEKILMAGSGYWKCKICKRAVHRKCRSAVTIVCSEGIEKLQNDHEHAVDKSAQEILPPAGIDVDEEDKPQKLLEDINLEFLKEKDHIVLNKTGSHLAFDVSFLPDATLSQTLKISCAYEMENQRILLLGCSTGLYALHMSQIIHFIDNINETNIPFLVHIALGIDSSICSIAVCTQLAKAILVGAEGKSLYQCDYRQLLSRCCSQVNSCLETTVLDLPFANRSSDERWQLVRISNKTVTSVTSILYTQHTAIVASDKFYEIDMKNYAGEEFLDLADSTLTHALQGNPIIAISLSRHEFLLCYMEFGIFVDEFGCRSRPKSLQPQVIATTGITKTQHTIDTVDCEVLTKIEEDKDGTIPNFERVTLPFYTPTLLADSGKTNVYVLAVNKENGLQK